MFVYESHLGGLYVSETQQSPEELYCDVCGDSDQLLGDYSTCEEFLKDFSSDISINGSGGWPLEYVLEDLAPLSTVTLDQAIKIVEKTADRVCCTKCKWFRIENDKPTCEHEEGCDLWDPEDDVPKKYRPYYTCNEELD